MGVVGLGHGQEITVTLLGTGGPRPQVGRFGQSILVEAGDEKLVFDVGRGAIQRLFQLGITYDEIDAVFFTHLHSDHIVGFPDFWLSGWLLSRRDRPLRVFGPAGTKQMLDHLTQAYSFDIAIRIADDGALETGSRFEVIEVEDGFEWSNSGVSVRAFDVDHRPIEPAFGYRVDSAGRSVALSGDTRYSENLIENAKGVDLLIHEVTGATEEFLASNPLRQKAYEHHTSAQQAGQIFSRTRPSLAVYSHMVLLGGYDPNRLISDTRQTYDGRVVLGEDLMQFVVGDDVEVIAP